MVKGVLIESTGRYYYVLRTAEGELHKVAVHCAVPILLTHVVEYELEAKESGGTLYAHQLVGWQRARFAPGIARVIWPHAHELAHLYNPPFPPMETFIGHCPLPDPLPHDAYVWMHFAALKVLCALTGRWQLHDEATLALLRARDWDALFRLPLHLEPEVLRLCAHSDERAEEAYFLNHLLNLTCEVGANVTEERMAQTYDPRHGGEVPQRLRERGLIRLRERESSLAWAAELHDAFAARFPAPEASVLQPDRQPVTFIHCAREALDKFVLGLGGRVWPAEGAGGVLVFAHCQTLSVRALLARGVPAAEHYVFVGDLHLPMDAFVAQRDLPVTGMRRAPWASVPERQTLQARSKDQGGAGPRGMSSRQVRGQVVQMLAYTGADRRNYLQGQFRERDVRVLHVFCHPRDAEFRQYAFAPASALGGRNLVCLRDCAGFAAHSVVQEKERGKYVMHGKHKTTIAPVRALFQPLRACFKEMMPLLRAPDFDYVVLHAHPDTSRRWLHEALRLAAEGTLMVYGFATL
jgi:hypothetical protein